MLNKEFVKALEQRTGLTLEQMRDMAPEDMRKLREKQHGKPMEFFSNSLVRILSRSQIEKDLDKALR
jgi:hypothetical protein